MKLECEYAIVDGKIEVEIKAGKYLQDEPELCTVKEPVRTAQ